MHPWKQCHKIPTAQRRPLADVPHDDGPLVVDAARGDRDGVRGRDPHGGNGGVVQAVAGQPAEANTVPDYHFNLK